MMYRCLKCGFKFEEPAEYEETHGELFPCCPQCEGDFEEIQRCKSCGKYFRPDDLEIGYCKGCIEKSMGLENIFNYIKDCPEIKVDLEELIRDDLGHYIDWAEENEVI